MPSPTPRNIGRSWRRQNNKKSGKHNAPHLGKYVRSAFIKFAAIPMILVSLLAMSVFVWAYYDYSVRESERNIAMIQNNLEECLSEYARIIDYCIENDAIITQMRVYRSLSAAARANLKLLLMNKADEIVLHLISGTNQFRYSTGAIPRIYNPQMYGNYGIFKMIKQAEPGKAALRATRYTTYNSKKIALSIGQVLMEQGVPTGYIIIDITRDKIAKVFKQEGGLNPYEITLVDKNSTVAFSTNAEYQEGVFLQEEIILEMLSARAENTAEGFVVTHNQDRYYLAPVAEGALWILVKTSDASIIRLVGMILYMQQMVFLCAVTIAWISGRNLSRKFDRGISKLLYIIEDSSEDKYQARYIPANDFDEIQRLGQHLNEMNAQTVSLIQNIKDKQRMLTGVQMNLLMAQIKPHSIYNVLNDIKSLAKLQRTEEIISMVSAFHRILRTSLTADEEFYQTSEEIDLVKSYVLMYNLRSAAPIDLRIHIAPELMDRDIPRFILEPLVENSIAHGLPFQRKPVICIGGEIRSGRIFFSVTDNGMGLANAKLYSRGSTRESHQGIGVKNVYERLKIHYGPEAGIKFRSKAGCYTKVILYMKCEND